MLIFFSLFLGCIIVPIYVSYLQFLSHNPLVYMGFLCLLALIFVAKLPETFGKQMQDFILEENNTSKYEIEMKNSLLLTHEEDDEIFKN